jgi:hypothetical protein
MPFLITDQAHGDQLRTLAGGKAHNLHTSPPPASRYRAGRFWALTPFTPPSRLPVFS